jgi:hypothetical protein
MEILGKILGSPARVKIMRLFLVNKNNNFNPKEVAERSRVGVNIVRRELRLLASVNFVKKRSASSTEWYYNPTFKYGAEFEELLVLGESLSNESIVETFKKVGKIKLLIVSGVFIKNSDSRVDLLIVGDNMKRGKIEEGIRKIEAEMGAELVYAVFETQEFLYRVNMYDKLIRDILDFPHEVLIQSKELSTQTLKKA